MAQSQASERQAPEVGDRFVRAAFDAELVGPAAAYLELQEWRSRQPRGCTHARRLRQRELTAVGRYVERKQAGRVVVAAAGPGAGSARPDAHTAWTEQDSEPQLVGLWKGDRDVSGFAGHCISLPCRGGGQRARRTFSASGRGRCVLPRSSLRLPACRSCG